MKVQAKGGEVYLEPTIGDQHRDNADREKRSAYEKHGRQTAAALKRRRDAEKKQPTDMEQREAAVEGIRRVQKKHTRDGQTDRGSELGKLADEAASVLQDYALATAELQGERPDPIADAIEAATRELRKTLPKTFPTDLDAQTYARKQLPMLEARAAAEKLADHFGSVSRRRTELNKDFWRIIEKAAAISGLNGDQVAELRKLGSM